MRDIRNDLRERLAAIAARYADEMSQYEQQREALDTKRRTAIAALDQERTVTEQLLAMEEQRAGTMPAGPAPVRSERLLPLAEFIITKVHAHGPIHKDDLRAEANVAGYFSDGDGRTFHTTLMNVTRCGKLRQLPDGRYEFPERGPAPLFGMGNHTGEEPATFM